MKTKPSKSPITGKEPFKNADPHNFGRSVILYTEDYVFKPRCIFWEWLFLGSSPLRVLLDNQTKRIFSCLPKLDFETDTSYRDGLVERFTCNHQLILTSVDLKQMGAILALFSFFGITDLHADNVIIGSKNGRFICGALDIESIFDKVELPAQTLMIPSRLIESTKCGYHKIISHSNEQFSTEHFLHIAEGYIEGLDFLKNSFEEINKIIANLIKVHNPIIRRVLRSTKQYAAFSKELADNSKFDFSEIEQLLRGDIPYFFKFPTTADVFFFADDKLEQIKSIEKNTFDKTTIENLSLNDFSDTIKIRYKLLKTNGLLQILRMIPSKCEPQNIKTDTLNLTLSLTDILIESSSMQPIRCKRIL